MIVKPSIKNQLKALNFWIRVSVPFCISGIIIFLFQRNLIWLLVCIGLPIVLGIPTFYLHVEYLIYTKYKKIITNYETNKIEVYKKDNAQSYSFSEIEKIIVYASPRFYKFGVEYLSFTGYHFAIINLKNDSRIIVTCLMAFPLANFIQQFEGVPVMYKKMFYPSILLRKLSW